MLGNISPASRSPSAQLSSRLPRRHRADVVKHTVLVTLVKAMQHKDKGIRFIDIHAGPALYDLDGEAARKNREFERGIGRGHDDHGGLRRQVCPHRRRRGRR